MSVFHCMHLSAGVVSAIVQGIEGARGNKYKLIQHHCHYNLRKFNFTNRVIPVWNSLPNDMVSADTINTFKNHLHNFWSDQEVLYDHLFLLAL